MQGLPDLLVPPVWRAIMECRDLWACKERKARQAQQV